MDSVALNSRNATRAGERSARGQVIRGLLYQEWLARGRLIMFYVSAWVIGVWILACFTHPAWQLVLGLIFAQMAAMQFGGADVYDGTEEFAFGLPPRRITRYLVRLCLGAGTMLLLGWAGLVATWFRIPQAVWGLVVESGFTEPGPAASAEWYAGAAVYPALAFALLFAFSATCQSRKQLVGLGGITVAAIFALWMVLHQVVRPRTTWWVPLVLLAVAAVVVIIIGAAFYVRKEGVNRPVQRGLDQRWTIILLVIGVLAFSILLSITLAERFGPNRDREPGTDKHEMTDTDGGL
jgi:hypothetical protein